MQLVITQEEMQKNVGQTVQVLAESVSRDNKNELLGKTARNEKVAFPAEKNMIGKFLTVHLDELSGHTYRGTVVN